MGFLGVPDIAIGVQPATATIIAEETVTLTCNLLIQNAFKDAQPVLNVTVYATVNDSTGHVWYNDTVKSNKNVTFYKGQISVPTTTSVQYFATIVRENTSKLVETPALEVQCK